jgi:2-polyprenyl-3-methyl-5-hydroxy-6-metoxy-1,4-benzoquinol methylase
VSKSTFEKRISDSHYRQADEYERSSKQQMRALVPAGPPRQILDIGCGTGLNALHLSKLGHTVIGIDLSPVAIEKFRAKGLEGHVVDIEASPLPFADDSFDMIYASEVIEHSVNTEEFLARLYRVLKPGGLLLLSTPNSAFWAYRILGCLGHTVTDYQHPGHVRFFSKRSLSKAVERAGFQIDMFSARHMYLIFGRRVGDPVAALLEVCGFLKEPRFATGDHFWQLSRFATLASPFWADTFIIVAHRPQAAI